ncbi:[Fe-Fe] hydrogenase large subunit C-terminal domain-containing protein [Candidatus Proelusimicrobium volucris]|uniref:[Fe-Fe] hydrogenase large subunit C-terminal domain-containing protein n=1 Tax=Candidatus Proelusimicrobium volucris TaxID=3416225 RepID=UPI003D0A00A1
MKKNYPIYTIKQECQDCYKCVRACPVKAIRVEEGHAAVIAENCVACGMCYTVCPTHAKHVRSDIEKAKSLIGSGAKVYASVAPSWAGILDCSVSRLVGMLKKLGFAGVSETALGAQQVSAVTAEFLNQAEPGVYFSSACPVCVDYISRYTPELKKYIVPYSSPALTHAELLKKTFGEDIKVVFIGPCIAKKNESDTQEDLIAAAITFEELKKWLFEEGIDLLNSPQSSEGFVPEKSSDGAVYPLEGGMLRSIRRNGLKEGVKLITVTGLKNFCKTLQALKEQNIDRVCFVECLACEGGCIKGPCPGGEVSTLNAFLGVEKQFDESIPPVKQAKYKVPLVFGGAVAPEKKFTEEEILSALAKVGKFTADDEINCDGCGYNTCRNFAHALLEGKAEPAMCVSYMRKRASRKANAILRCIPSGVVIFDNNLEIIESNQPFAKIAGADIEELFEQIPGLKGAALGKILPFEMIFKRIFKDGKEIHKERIPFGKKLLDMTIFPIEEGQTAGLIVQDVTKSELHREIIAQKAQEVLRKNILAVQEVAGRLGENIAETEIILNYITEGFGPEKK